MFIKPTVILFIVLQKSGIYTVYPDKDTQIQVYCDMETTGGGWTVFQRRQDGSINFNQSWNGYKQGFGNLSGEFWLGNDHLAQMTAMKVYKLHIDLQDFDLWRVYAEYDDFLVLSEERLYRLVLGKVLPINRISIHKNLSLIVKCNLYKLAFKP